jgi:outer membrane protein OmpA-like peptidoglycan-associated protein
VVAALNAQSIAVCRAHLGPDKRIAPNDPEEGRGKNRRLELVKN